MHCYKLLAYFVKYFTGSRQSFYRIIKNKDILVKAKIKYSGSKLILNIGDFIQFWIFMDGAYEVETLGFVASIINGKELFDVGANIGSYTLSLHSKAKYIYAFEASKTNIGCLNENIRGNKIKNVMTIHKAVSDEDNKKVKLYLSPDTGGNNSVYERFNGEFETVETVTLDSFYANNEISSVDVIKIDVEGAEFDVIRGANEVLDTFKPVLIIEFNKFAADKAGYNLEILYDHLKNMKFNAYTLRNYRLGEVDRDIFKNGEFNQNLIFINENSPLTLPPQYHFI